MSLFEKPTERRTILVNLKLTETQVAAVDRIAAAMGLSSRSDVLRAGLESLITHHLAAAKAALQLNDGSEPRS